jgi:hypothetical protein
MEHSDRMICFIPLYKKVAVRLFIHCVGVHEVGWLALCVFLFVYGLSFLCFLLNNIHTSKKNKKAHIC